MLPDRPVPDTLRVSDLEVSCIVGVHPRERHVPQTVRVSFALELDVEAAGRDERMSATIDYGALAGEVSFILQAGRFRLLETACLVVARALLLPPAPEERRAPARRGTVAIRKPTALPGAAVPEIEVTRDHGWARVPRERRAFGTVEVLHAGRDGRVERIRFAPGLALTEQPPAGTGHAHFVRGGQVLVDGYPMGPGPVPARLAARRWHNPGHGSVSLLRVEAPRAVSAGSHGHRAPP